MRFLCEYGEGGFILTPDTGDWLYISLDSFGDWMDNVDEDVILYSMRDMRTVNALTGVLYQLGYVRSAVPSPRYLTSLMTPEGRFISVAWANKNKIKFKLYDMNNLVRDDKITDPLEYMQALERMGAAKPTVGSMALMSLFGTIKRTRFESMYPRLDHEACKKMRQAYLGGFMQATPGIYTHGWSLDYNQLYPYQLVNNFMPCGQPIAYEGEYDSDPVYPLHVDEVSFYATVKEDGIAWLPNPEYNLSGHTRLASTGGVITMVLTNIDWQNLTDNYDVWVEAWHGGWKMMSQKGFYDEWVHKMYEPSNLDGLRPVRKMLTNGLIGRLGSRRSGVVKRSAYNYKTKRVSWELEESHQVDWYNYPPLPSFVTAYGRRQLFSLIKQVGARNIYANTDNIILTGDTLPDGLDIGENIGQLKIEREFRDINILGVNRYAMKLMDDSDYFCVAGITLPHSLAYEEFKKGAKIETEGQSFIL